MLPNIVQQKIPSKELQREITEADLREQIVKFGLNGDHDNMVIALDALGELYDSHSRFAEAEFCYLAAIKAVKMRYGQTSPETASAYARLSAHYVVAQLYDKAEKANAKAIRILSSSKDPDEFKLAIMYHNQAWLETGYSSFRSAEQHYKQSVSLLNQVLGPSHLMVALTLNNLGKLYKLQSKYSEAETAFAKTYEIFSIQIPNEETFKSFLKNYADVLHNVGKHSKAKEMEARFQASKK